MKIKTVILAVFASMAMPSASWAQVCVAPPLYVGQTETVFSLGIQFDFGDMQPGLVASARRTKTDTSNDVIGGKLDVILPFLGDDKFKPKIRAMGVVGKPEIQGEFGAGYDFATQQPLVGVGVQGPYVFGGADLLLDGQFHPFVGASSYGGAAERKDFLLK